jgi:hypothetical protein
MKKLNELKFFNVDTDREIEIDGVDSDDSSFDEYDALADDDSDLDLDSVSLDDPSLDKYSNDEDNEFDLLGDDDSDDLSLDVSDLDFEDETDLSFDDNPFDDNTLGSDENETLPDADMDAGDEIIDSDSELDEYEALAGDESESEDASLTGEEDGDEFGEEDPEASDYQGMIRTVKGAYLVYKRLNDSGEYDELWIYNIGNDMKAESNIRRAILSGTDIPPNRESSADGVQKATSYSVGNVQFIEVTGLPN